MTEWKGYEELPQGKKIYRLPENFTPNRIVVVREGDRVDIYYGRKGEQAHGHSVFKSGKQVYARSRLGSFEESKDE